MSMNEHETKFREEIESRISSAPWDRRIAERVLARRRKRLVVGTVFGGTGLAAAALVIALTMGLFTAGTQVSAPVNALIAAQVDGTYSEVFAGGAKKTAESATSSQDLDSYDSVDEMIDATLAMR